MHDAWPPMVSRRLGREHPLSRLSPALAVLERDWPMGVVNIVGSPTSTISDGADTLIACDTGPGNALARRFHVPTRLASTSIAKADPQPKGCGCGMGSSRALQHPFFALPPPKLALTVIDFASILARDACQPMDAQTLTRSTAVRSRRSVQLTARK